MKKWTIISSVILSCVVASTTMLVTIPHIQAHKNVVPEEIIDKTPLMSKPLKVENYFENYPGDFQVANLRSELKKRINRIIKRYRLDEWNIYYEKNANKHAKSQIWNFSMSDFNLRKVNYKQNSEIKSKYQHIQTTSTYRNQDAQFRYFNDFINIFNNDGKNLDDDFLYLRWLYYSLSMSKHSHQKVNLLRTEKALRDITLTDWITAIGKAIAGEVQSIEAIFQGFVQYYISPAPKAYLCAMDMIMRYDSKPDDEVQRYQQWAPKIKRAIEIFEITQNEFNILPNSLEPLDGNEPQFDEENKEEVMGILKELKKVAATILEQATQLTRVNAIDYYIKERVNE